MPRHPRLIIPGAVYHVFNRGVKQLPIFHEDRDRSYFLRLLCQTQQLFPFTLLSYTLMTNHYHFVLQTIDHSISRVMQYFSGQYGAWHNRAYRHIGHVFQGRYNAIWVAEERYLMRVCRYVHLNPVKAGLVEKPGDYRWSNYLNLIEGRPDGLTDPRLLLDHFGTDIANQRSAYQQFVEEDISRTELITEKTLLKMRIWGDPPAWFRQKVR